MKLERIRMSIDKKQIFIKQMVNGVNKRAKFFLCIHTKNHKKLLYIFNETSKKILNKFSFLWILKYLVYKFPIWDDFKPGQLGRDV